VRHALTTIEVYEAIKGRLGEEESRRLLQYIDEKVTEEVATKKDVADLRGDVETLRGDFKALDEKLSRQMESIWKEIGFLRGTVERVRADMIRWMFIFWVGQVGAILAILKLVGVF